ncbi:MAG: NAD-dependent epimerase/dehydratase family protein [Planctomycetota bacterium]
MTRIPEHAIDSLRAKLDGKRCCVTGGAGFIGGHVVDALVSLGASVSVIDDLTNSDLGHLGQVIEMEPGRCRFLQASILDPDGLASAVDGAHLVLHLAARSSVSRSLEDPERTWAINATGTLRVLQAARDQGVKRVVYSASSSAYGDAPGLPKRETSAPEPLSPYAASKLAGEHLASAYADSYGLSAVSLRYFNVFGPRQPADSPYAGVIPAFAKKLKAGERPVIYGDGEQTRDFTYVANIVYANLLAATVDAPLAGDTINIGTGDSTSINTLARIMASAHGRDDLTPEHRPVRAGDVRDSQADLSRARDLLGYEPFIDFEQGLELAVDWYRTAAADVS